MLSRTADHLFWMSLLGSDTNFAATLCVAPAGRATGSANLGSDPKNAGVESC
jgi:hypothetical protein